ncbi:g-type lectin s-receptor-like serine/threonine-protein kinase ces101 [Quercus suber]|uniref:G-type lectin s-receptor-like serine/threonine-protein kinase ces101 n=1 Tax=Quercus suber TaxID=58331 RepID=A0AAW0LY31_QUESU
MRLITKIPTLSSTPNGSMGRSAREATKPPVESKHKLDVDTSDLATEKFEKTLHEIDTKLGWNPNGMDVSLEHAFRDKCGLKKADSVDGLRNLYKLGPKHYNVDNGLSFKAENGPIEKKEPPHSHVALTSKLRSPSWIYQIGQALEFSVEIGVKRAMLEGQALEFSVEIGVKRAMLEGDFKINLIGEQKFSLFFAMSKIFHIAIVGAGCKAQCRSHDDTFTPVSSSMKDGFKFDESDNLIHKDCEAKCFHNCSCVAYASTDQVAQTGCEIWSTTNRFIGFSNPNARTIYFLTSALVNMVDLIININPYN